MTTELIRVLIADDHPIVRQGLEIVINSQPDLKLVGQAANGNEALALFGELKPDVVVPGDRCDEMPGSRSVESRNCAETIDLNPYRDHSRPEYTR
jgi:DNA-binding NarL/FixJ family response regulator